MELRRSISYMEIASLLYSFYFSLTAGFCEIPRFLTTAQLSVSDGLVEVTGPYGMLTAGKLVFEASVDDGKETMLFQNGVQLVYFQQ